MTDEEKNIFGNQLRERRNELNLTTQKVALDAEVGESTYKRLEAGDGNPRLDTLVKIVKCLKTDLNSVVPQEHLCKDAGIWQIVRKLLSMDKKKMNKARYDWNSRRTGRENAVDAAFCRIWAVRT